MLRPPERRPRRCRHRPTPRRPPGDARTWPSPRAGTRRASSARAPRRCAAVTDRWGRAGSRRWVSRSSIRELRLGRREPCALPEMTLHEVGSLVADERITVALARDQIRVQLGDEELLLELGRAGDDRAVRRDDLGTAPERDAVLMADAVREEHVHGQVLRVEPVHQTARLRRAEIAAFGA